MSLTLLVPLLLATGCGRPPTASDTEPSEANAAPEALPELDGVSLRAPTEPPPLDAPPAPAEPPTAAEALAERGAEPTPDAGPPEAPSLTASMSWCGQPSCDPVLTFSHPVADAEALGTTPIPDITLDPPQPGSWRWLDARRLRFESAEDAFPHGAEVQITVAGARPAGFDTDTLGTWTHSVWVPHFRVGNKVASWAVRPGHPRFVGFLDHFRKEIGRGQLYLLYDQPVEPADLADELEVTDAMGRHLPVDVTRPDDIRHAVPHDVDLRHIVAVDLHYDPPADSVITVRPPSAEDEPVAWDLTVDDHLGLVEWFAYGSSRERIDPGEPMDRTASLRLEFTDPVQPELLAEMNIEPTPLSVHPVGNASYPGLRLELAPGTRYTLTPHDALVDALGNPPEPFAIRFRSRDLPPELRLPALPITSELARPELEIRGRNLADLTVTAYDFPSGEAYARALARGARERCSDHGLHGDGTEVAPPSWAASPNARATTTVDLPGTPGLRCIEVSATGLGTESTGRLTQAVLVQTSDLGATAKVYEGSVMTWVTSLSDAAPVADAAVHLVDGRGTSLSKGVTDLRGIFALTGIDDAHDHGVADDLFVVASHGDDRLVLRLAEDRLSAPWRFAMRGATDDTPPLAAALFTERGAYRPGDTVHATLMAGPELAASTARLEVVDARGQQVAEARRELDGFGVGSLSVDLPSGAAVGVYTLRAAIDGRTTTRSFRVEEYRIPTFEVAIDTEQAWVRDSPAAAVIGATYLHGGTLDGRAVQYTVTRQPVPFTPASFPGFRFTARDHSASVQTLDSGSVRLDGEGRRTVRFTPDHASSVGPMRYTVEASVTDLDRQEYTGRHAQVVHPAAFYVGVKPPTRRVLNAGDPLEVPIVAVSPEGQAVPGVQVRARLERVDHHQTVRMARGSAQTLNRPVAADGVTCTVRTTDSATSCTFTVPEAGMYRVRAWARDADQRDVQAGFQVAASGGEPTAWPRFDNERIEIVADKPSYRPGDTARLVVQTPFASATGLLTIERDGILEQRVFTIDRDTPHLDVPITGDMAPNVYASVALLRGRAHDQVDATGFQTGAPAFRLGITELAVDTQEQRLAVDVQPARDIAVPGSELSVDVSLTDPDGQPVAGQVAVMVVDEAVLGLTGHQTPDPVAELYPEQPLGVRTADSRLELAHAKRARREVLFPGGDGGMVPGQLPTNELRNLFESTAFYDPAVEVGPDGRGTVHFELPDNTTTFRVMAVAIDAAGRAGSADDQVTVKQPLMVQPVLPRFVHPGDALQISAILHNGTDEALPAEVVVDTEGATLADDTLTTTVPAQGTVTVDIPVSVVEIRDREELVVRYAAVMGVHTDQVEVTIPLREPGVRRKQLVEERIAGRGQLSVTLPDDRVRGSERVEVVASTTPLTKLKDSVGYLLGYPNGCIEQTTSRAYPLVVLEDLLPEIGVDVPPDELRDYAEHGVRRILSFQTEGGGLSYWPGGTEPHAFATSFGLTALIEARERGYDVPDASLERMADFLELTLRKGNVTESIPHGSIADGDTRALFVMTLGRLGRPQPAYLANLWDERDKLTPFGLSFLAIAASEMGDGHALTEPILAEVRRAAEEDAAAAWYEGTPRGGYSMDSPLRTHASALLAYASGARSADVTPKLLEGLLQRQRRGLWGNTQENVFGIMGVYTLAAKGGAAGGDAPKVQLAHNGADIPTDGLEAMSANALRLTLGPDALADATQTFDVRSLGVPAELTVRAEYDVQLTDANRAPRSAGATIERSYTSMDGAALSDTIPLGELVKVRLVVTTDEDLNYVAIDDKLPAGLEPLNTSLATTRTVDMGDLDAATERGLSHLSYQEIRDHRVAFYADELPAGTVAYEYVARATTPGEFLRPAAGVEAMYDLSTYASTAIDEVAVVRDAMAAAGGAQ